MSNDNSFQQFNEFGTINESQYKNNDLYLSGKFKSTTEKVYNEYIKTCMKTKGF